MADNFVDAVNEMKAKMARANQNPQNTAKMIVAAQRQLLDVIRTNPQSVIKKMTGTGK